MPNRLALLCLLVLIIIALGGCGGGGDSTAVLIAGQYFPLTVGTTWLYDTQLEVETPSETFVTTGTFTRRLAGKEPVAVNGETVMTYEFDQSATTNALPNLTGSASLPLVPAINYLFSASGGLQPVKAYYRLVGTTAELQQHLTLVAYAENDRPVTVLPQPRNILYLPPYQGTAQTASSWLVPMPLMPPMRDMTNLTVHDKLLDYGEIDQQQAGEHTRTPVASSGHYPGALLPQATTRNLLARGRGRLGARVPAASSPPRGASDRPVSGGGRTALSRPRQAVENNHAVIWNS